MSGVLVQRIGACFVLRGRDELTPDQIEWIGALRPEPRTSVALVTVPPSDAAQLGPALSELLEQLRDDRLVLALSGAGKAGAGRVPAARQIAEDWGLTVVAPAGDVFLAPGGSLFSQGGWLAFTPTTMDARRLGLRWPVPDWTPADDVTSLGTLELRPVPAGMMLCPAGSPASEVDGVAFAVPVQRERPAILCAIPPAGVPGALALLSLFLERHRWDRHPLLLIPVTGTDPLPLARALAREKTRDVEVLSGFPVSGGSRALLTDSRGRVTWSPFIASVLCRPADLVPLIWRSPVEGLSSVDPVRPEYSLSPDWHLTLTRAGLWLHAPGEVPPDDCEIDAETVRLDVGLAGSALPFDAASLLSGVIAALGEGIRARLAVTVRARVSADHRADLADIASQRGVSITFRDAPSPWSPSTGLARGSVAPASPPSGTDIAEPASSRRRRPLRPGDRPGFHRPTGDDRYPGDRRGREPGDPVASPPENTSPPAGPGVLPTSSSRFPAGAGPGGAGRPEKPHPRASTIEGPKTPVRRSTPAERDHVRALIADRWDDLAPAVSRAFARIPAIGAGDRAAAAIDLAAVKHYLETGFDGDDAYRACLASGLSRLPTHRGPVLRGVDLAQAESAVGSVVTVPGPCGGTTLSLSDETPRPATTALYVIWSQTARILAPLFDDRLRTGDVMFSPGTELVVLDSRAGGRHGLDLILLQEIPPAGQPYPDALADLRRALDATALLPAGDRGAWPAYALGPVGGLRASAGI